MLNASLVLFNAAPETNESLREPPEWIGTETDHDEAAKDDGEDDEVGRGGPVGRLLLLQCSSQMIRHSRECQVDVGQGGSSP